MKLKLAEPARRQAERIEAWWAERRPAQGATMLKSYLASRRWYIVFGVGVLGVWGFLGFTDPLGASGFSMFVNAFAFCCIIVALVRFCRSGPIAKRLDGIGYLSLGVALIAMSGYFIRTGRKIIQNEMQSVIPALESYRTTHDSYPNSIEDLIPRYVSYLPSCLGSSIGYWREKDGSYHLICGYGPWLGLLVYDSRTGTWKTEQH